jgi:hypothetical protein
VFEARAEGNSLQLCFIMSRRGAVDGETLERESAVRLVPGEDLEFFFFGSSERMEMLMLVVTEVEGFVGES